MTSSLSLVDAKSESSDDGDSGTKAADAPSSTSKKVIKTVAKRSVRPDFRSASAKRLQPVPTVLVLISIRRRGLPA